MATSRATNIQVPGEQPAAQPSGQPDAASAGAAPPSDKPADTPPEVSIDALRAREKDWEAMREQIRAEERDKARIELGAAITSAPRSKHDYRNMRAADIDPATLTAPVMTLDGYLCPPAPEAKK